MIANFIYRIASIVCILSCIVSHAPAAAHTSLTVDVDLSDWGLSSPSQIGYVSIGILHKNSGDEIIVYDIREQKPVARVSGTPHSRIPTFEGDVFLVSNFDYGNTNRLGGYFNALAKMPSESSLAIGSAPCGTHALNFSYSLVPPTFAGFWIHLFNFKAPPEKRFYLDAAPFTYLTFTICGHQGGEELLLQIADSACEKKEESLVVGDVGAFIPSGKITTQWQQAWVPLESFPTDISTHDLASIVFLAKHGSGTVYMKDLAFSTKKDAQIPTATGDRDAERSLHKAMWLWETKKIEGSREEREQLAAFCRNQGITDVFMQIPYEMKERNGEWNIVWDSSNIKSLISAVHNAGARVHALYGDPRFALREWHDHVLSLIGNIIEYNKEVTAQERFDGIRYDNELYLLHGSASVTQESILKQYLDLLKETKKLAVSAGLELGVDIPFWFDGRNEFFEPLAELGGRPMSELIIDIVDNIGIMDYRTQAYGADGIIANAHGELTYASENGTEVYVGLETGELPDETICEFGTGDSGVHIAIESLGDRNARISLGGDGGTILHEMQSISVPASKLTFAGKKVSALTMVMRQAAAELQQFPSFHGFAIHSYESYRPWCLLSEQ